MENLRRSSSTIPFGYKLSESDNQMLEPVQEELQMLDKILPMVKDEVVTLDKFGPQSTILTGQLGSIFGMPIVVSPLGS